MKRKPLKAPLQIAEILQNVLKRKGITEKIAQYMVFDVWETVVGPTLAKSAKPKKMQGSTLIVQAKNASWANELSYMKRTILKKIKEAVPEAVITDIKFTAV